MFLECLNHFFQCQQRVTYQEPTSHKASAEVRLKGMHVSRVQSVERVASFATLRATLNTAAATCMLSPNAPSLNPSRDTSFALFPPAGQRWLVSIATTMAVLCGGAASKLGYNPSAKIKA